MLLTRACAAASFLLLGACSIPDANYYEPEAEENVTVGTVQREVRIGMSSAEVVEVKRKLAGCRTTLASAITVAPSMVRNSPNAPATWKA